MNEHGKSTSWRVVVVLSLAVAMIVAGTLYPVQRRSSLPERIILIVVDTLRADHLSCYGSSTPTPNIDRLAAEGQRFENAVSSFHQTTMSMASMFTARTPSIESGDVSRPLPWNGKTWCGLSRFADPSRDDSCIPQELPTLAEAFREAGYWTIGIVSNPLVFEPAGYRKGFDDWVEVGTEAGPVDVLVTSRSAGPVNEEAARALRRQRPNKFFLYVHYMDVHDYWLRNMSYAEAAAAVDAGVGALLDGLRADGLLDNAVVVLTSDHGERLGETHAVRGRPSHQGNPSFETVLRVPLIVWPPVMHETPKLIRSEDALGLLTGLAGISDLGHPDLASDELFLTEAHFLTYRRIPWKSSLNRADKSFYLFNLADDPGETRNVADTHPQVASAHRHRILELASRLVAVREPPADLSDQDLERLRALGYIEQGDGGARQGDRQ